MTTVTAVEAKTMFGELLNRVLAGEEIVITRHGKPVARLIPERSPRLENTQRAAAGLEGLQEEIAEYCAGKSPIPWQEFKSFVEEGRR